MVITGGEISCSLYGKCGLYNEGELIVGSESSKVDVGALTIKTGGGRYSYAIYTKLEFKFYNGIVKSKSNGTLYNKEPTCRTGYTIEKGEEYKNGTIEWYTAYLVKK